MSDTIKRTITLAGCIISTDVPANAEHYDKLSPGGPGSCVSDAVTTGIYRGYANLVRDGIADALIALTGVAKRPSGKKTPKGADVAEASDKYIEFIRAEGAVSEAKINEIAATFVKANSFCDWLSDSSRSTGGRIGAEYLEVAQGIMDKWAAGFSTPDKSLAKFQELLPNATLSDEPTLEEIALLVKRYRAAQKQAEF